MNHWRCLGDSMWSQVPAVQVMAWRQLKALVARGELWAQDMLDMMYMEDEVKAWADAGVTSDDDDSVPTVDSNGAVLVEGDSVTLIRIWTSRARASPPSAAPWSGHSPDQQPAAHRGQGQRHADRAGGRLPEEGLIPPPSSQKRPQGRFFASVSCRSGGTRGKLDYPANQFRGMPLPDCQCANGEGLPGTHGRPGHPDPHGAHETRSRPMASKKEIKKKIAARQAKIANTKARSKAEKALKRG